MEIQLPFNRKLSAKERIFREKCLKDNDEKIKEKVTKKEKFTKLPPVLILTLQRFKTRKTYSQKINCLIEFPLTDLKIENEEYD